jgi:hypothetical protein
MNIGKRRTLRRWRKLYTLRKNIRALANYGPRNDRDYNMYGIKTPMEVWLRMRLLAIEACEAEVERTHAQRRRERRGQSANHND